MENESTATSLQGHMLKTYFEVRWGLIALAILLPIGLPLWGLARGIEYQHSLSAYYHARSADGATMRDVFVGLLFVVGALLYLYKGYSRWENWLLNAAGLLIVGVALVPMEWPERLPQSGEGIGAAAVQVASLHGTFAIGFFLCIAAVCWFCSESTLKEMTDVALRRRYKRWYVFLAAIMGAAPVGAFVLSSILSSVHLVIFVESAGVIAFGAYWLVKTAELTHTRVEANALVGALAKTV